MDLVEGTAGAEANAEAAALDAASSKLEATTGALAEEEADILRAKVRQLRSDLNVSKFTLEQAESEIKSLTTSMSKASGGPSRPRRKKTGTKKKKGAGGKKGKGGGTDESNIEGNEESGDITYAVIARKFPNIKLAEVLRAEKDFASADLDGDGTIDVKELDKFLTKKNLIFSVSQVTAILQEIDTDSDNKLDFLEYLTVLTELSDPERVRQRQESMAPKTATAMKSIRRAFGGFGRGRRASRANLQPSNPAGTEGSEACVLQ